MSEVNKPSNGLLFQRAVTALNNVGVHVSKPYNVNNILSGIRRARGFGKPTQMMFFGEGVEIIETWLREVEAPTETAVTTERFDSWRDRPAWVPDRRMRVALDRCAESRPRVSPLRGVV